MLYPILGLSSPQLRSSTTVAQGIQARLIFECRALNWFSQVLESQCPNTSQV